MKNLLPPDNRVGWWQTKKGNKSNNKNKMIMKKIFTLMLLSVMTVAVNAAVTIYVQAEEAPYIWAWNAAGNILSEGWPGHQLTEKATVQGTEFWTYTFGDEVATPINILFNNGGVSQTGDINGITSDRYFTYDGASTWTDVTEQYGGTIPDAEVNTLTLKGNHDEWADDVLFDVVEPGKTFTYTMDLAGMEIPEDYWQFKIRPNGQGWVGITQVTLTSQPEWLGESQASGNFQIDLDGMAPSDRKFTITASWPGGKDAEAGWTVTIVQATGTGIVNMNRETITNNQYYTLDGRRVENPTKGLYIVNGKKVVVK